MDMRIQYGNMNPYEQLPGAVATGLGLGMQMRKTKSQEQGTEGANLNVSDPGQRPTVDMEKMFAKETQYINRMKDVDSHLNKVSDPIAKEGARQSIVNRWDEPLTKEAIKNNMNVKDLQNTLNGVMNNDPASRDRLDALIAQAGGPSSSFAKAVQQKSNQIQATQNKLDQDYALKLKTHLMGIKEFRNNPQKFAHKGQAGEQLLQYNSQAGERLLELAKIPGNEKWVEAWLADEQRRGRMSGGGGRADKEYVVFSSDGKNRMPFQASGADEARRIIETQYPEFDSSTIKALGREENAIAESAINPAVRGGSTAPSVDKYTVGKVYKDASGKQAKYLGNGKWQPL